MPTPNRSPFNLARWTTQDAEMVLGALERSGQSVREFAEEHGLDPQRLYVWRRRVAGGDRTTFRELVVRGSSSPRESSFEVVLPSGVVVRVPPSFDAGALGRLLDVVSQAPC